MADPQKANDWNGRGGYVFSRSRSHCFLLYGDSMGAFCFLTSTFNYIKRRLHLYWDRQSASSAVSWDRSVILETGPFQMMKLASPAHQTPTFEEWQLAKSCDWYIRISNLIVSPRSQRCKVCICQLRLMKRTLWHRKGNSHGEVWGHTNQLGGWEREAANTASLEEASMPYLVHEYFSYLWSYGYADGRKQEEIMLP